MFFFGKQCIYYNKYKKFNFQFQRQKPEQNYAVFTLQVHLKIRTTRKCSYLAENNIFSLCKILKILTNFLTVSHLYISVFSYAHELLINLLPFKERVLGYIKYSLVGQTFWRLIIWFPYTTQLYFFLCLS